MVRLTAEAAAPLFKGRAPREIYDLAWQSVAKAPDARINDLDEIIIWLVGQGYLSQADLNEIEADPQGQMNGRS